MFTKAANKNWIKKVWQICLSKSMVTEVWSHQSNLGGHRGLEGTLNKFLKGFFLLSARQKLRFLNSGCDTCLTKEQSLPVRTREHVRFLTVGEKIDVDLVSMLETMRGNRNMLIAEDRFSRYCWAYPIPNKEACTVAKVLLDQYFNVYGLPDQLHSDNGKEFVKNLWIELVSEFKIQCNTTPPYNPSSNHVKHFHRTITAMLLTRGPGVQDNWDLWLNASVFAYNTTVSSSTGVTPYYAMFRCKAALPVGWVFPTPSVEKRMMYH